MSEFIVEYHINALKDIRAGLDENIQKVSRQVHIDQIKLDAVNVPCSAILSFIKDIMGQIGDVESLEDKLQASVSALIKLEKYSSDYMSNERHSLSKKIGMIEGFQAYAQSIDEHIAEKKAEIEKDSRLQERIESGENLDKRQVGTRPEKLKDLRNFKERASE